MSIGRDQHVVICGAGLAGSLLASYLAKLGYQVDIYERRGDPRLAGYSGGRSINLALSARGLWGLDGIGLRDEILAHAIPMRGRIMHKPAANPELIFQPYSKNPTDAINSISRGGLNLALIHAAAKHPNVRIFFNHRCIDIDQDHNECIFVDETTGPKPDSASPVRVKADLILGADGAFSPVRARLQKNERFDYSQTFLTHGYKELTIPPAPDQSGPHKGYALDPNALHIWPRGAAMMIALPNPDKSFTCTLFWPFEGDHSFSNLNDAESVKTFFEAHYPDAVPLMPTLIDDFLKNPVGSLVTVRCWPWVRHNAVGSIALLGDAAHAIVPFFGQGMNAAFEDVRTFAECLEKHRGQARPALDEYQQLRKPNADAIADMALENFIEMRDKVGSQTFLYRKKLEHALHDLLPGSLIPRYNLVSFSTVPYVEALAAGKRFDAVIHGIVTLAILAAAFVICLCLFFVGVPLLWAGLILVLAAVFIIASRHSGRSGS